MLSFAEKLARAYSSATIGRYLSGTGILRFHPGILLSGQRLTRASYERYRKQDGWVIIHNDFMESIVTEAVAHPATMIFSAAFLSEEGSGHRRSAGTHARVLGRYVRELGVVSLRDALRKMSLMPAQVLESRVPLMKRKGRIRESAEADIVVFDAETISDEATFHNPTLPSKGVRFVLINGDRGSRRRHSGGCGRGTSATR